MKYRGNHSGNYTASGQSSSYYYHQQRSTGPPDISKPGRGRSDHGGGAGGGAGGQGQIELVEKILTQISMHQSANGGTGNRGRASGVSLTAGSDRGRNSYVKKNTSQQYGGNSVCGGQGQAGTGGRFKSNNKFAPLANNSSFSYLGANKERPFFASNGGDQMSTFEPVDSSGQCCQCEYVFTDGQLMPKFECTHKSVTSSSPQNVRGGNHLLDDGSKSPFSKAYVNRNNMKGIGADFQQEGITGKGELITSGPVAKVANPRESIIPKKKRSDMKKFVEAEIVFGHNMIDVVPVAGGGGPLSALQLLTSSMTSQTANGVITEKSGEIAQIKAEPMVSECLAANALHHGAVPPVRELIKRVESGGCGGKSTRKSKSKCASAAALVQLTSVASSKSHSSVKHLDHSKSSSHSVECQPRQRPSSRRPSPSAVVESSQTVKKIRCLIANFITIQVEEAAEEHSEESIQEDILQLIDREKLGFQNFDGKNIGLYKNIGYINRNRAKFVRPTQELLQLMVSPKLYAQEQKSSSLPAVSELTLNLDQFYDLDSAHSYDKATAYSVLQSLKLADGHLGEKIKGRKFRYPDGEYSTELDDFLMHASGGGRGGGSIHSLDASHSSLELHPSHSSLTEEKSHSRWSESENEPPTMESISSSFGSPAHRPKLATSSRPIKNASLAGGLRPETDIPFSVSISYSEESTEKLQSDEQLYESYFVTEVTFILN